MLGFLMAYACPKNFNKLYITDVTQLSSKSRSRGFSPANKPRKHRILGTRGFSPGNCRAKALLPI